MLGVLLAAAAVLLVAAGLAKVAAPAPAARMLTSSVRVLRGRRRVLVPLMRGAGVAEAAIGAVVVLAGGRIAAALLGAAYLVFAVVAVGLVRAGGSVSCGCFGRADSPVGLAHVALNVTCVVLAASAVVDPVGRFAGLAGHGALVSTVGGAQAVLLAWLAYLAVTALPALTAARREVQTR